MTATATTVADTRYLSLDVYSSSGHRIFPVLFANEDVALAWIARHPWTVEGPRSDTYLVGDTHEGDDTDSRTRPVDPDLDPKLYAYLYPDCEHGMSARLCSGPNHFGEPTDDWAN